MKPRLVVASLCALLAFGAAGASVPTGTVIPPAPAPSSIPPTAAGSNAGTGSGTLHGQAPASQQSRLQYCNVLADKEGMDMSARKTFMTACLKN